MVGVMVRVRVTVRIGLGLGLGLGSGLDSGANKSLIVHCRQGIRGDMLPVNGRRERATKISLNQRGWCATVRFFSLTHRGGKDPQKK